MPPATNLTPDVLRTLVPQWTHSNIKISRLPAGLTNLNYLLEVDDQAYLAKQFGKGTENIIDRAAEAQILSQLEGSQLAPQLVGFFPDRRLMVTCFISGVPLTRDHFLLEDWQDRAVDLLLRLHHLPAKRARPADPSARLRELLKWYWQLDQVCREFDLSKVTERISQLTNDFQLDPNTYVLCHNDLTYENFIARNSELHLIDWEYAGMSSPYCDLADWFQEIEIGPEVERALIAKYFADQDVELHHDRTNRCKLFADAYWFYWSLIQSKVSSIDYNFLDYAAKRYQMIMANPALTGEYR